MTTITIIAYQLYFCCDVFQAIQSSSIKVQEAKGTINRWVEGYSSPSQVYRGRDTYTRIGRTVYDAEDVARSRFQQWINNLAYWLNIYLYMYIVHMNLTRLYAACDGPCSGC